MPLYAGVCETNITPPVGVWMCGYAFRPSGCTAVHDELYARAAVFSNGKKTVALLSMDLIGLDFDLVALVREGIAHAIGIPPQAVMLNATHTHGGPNVQSFNAMGTRDPAYIDVLVRKLVGAARQASDQMRPARVAVGAARAQIGVNRRQTGTHGTTIGHNFAGPVDMTVASLEVADSRGEPFALLFTHACHGTTLGGDNLQITADWPGYACDHIRRETGGRVIPMFLQGCAGNINPLDRGTFESARRNGEAVGAAALEPVGPWVMTAGGHDDVDCSSVALGLPVAPPPPTADCESDVAEWRAKLAAARRDGHVGATMNAEGMLAYAEAELARARGGQSGPAQPFEIQCLRVVDLPILGMPGEVFVQYGLDFSFVTGRSAFALGYTNGIHGYLPTAADFALGGYEVSGANRYYGKPMVTPECEGIIREAAYGLLGAPAADRAQYSLDHQPWLDRDPWANDEAYGPEARPEPPLGP